MMNGLKYICLLIFLGGNLCIAYGQNFIGLNPAEIDVLMKKSSPQFKLDKNAVNHAYKYLKYVDKISEQTALFFISEKNNKCTYVRWMSDYSNLNDFIEVLDKNYKKSGINSWSFTEKGENYSVTLVEDEWYFTVNYRKD